MSSHHIIRDRQEPAVLIWDNADDRILTELLQWSPILIVHENLFDKVSSLNYKIDYILFEKSKPSILNLLYTKNLIVDDVIHLNQVLLKEDILQLNILTENAIDFIQNSPFFCDNYVIYDSKYCFHQITNGFSKWFFNENIILLHATNQTNIEIDGFFEYKESSPIWLGFEF